MANFLKHALLIIVSLSTSIGVVQAKFHQRILDDAMEATSPNYRIGGQLVSPAVQAAYFLAHELSLKSDPEEAKNVADTLIALLSAGRGVGGISKRSANGGERPLMEGALREAARFLKALEHQNQEKFKKEQQAHKQSHLDRVTEIMRAAYAEDRDARRPTYNAALKIKIDKLKVAEEAADPSVDYKKLVADTASAARKAGKNDFEAVGNLLKTTVIREKADYLANKAILVALKKQDFSAAVDDSVVDALIAAETYRMFETKQGTLERADPNIFAYQNTRKSAESEAVLLALVSAIQDSLYNSALEPEDLVRLFKYKINSRLLARADVRVAAKAMIEDGSIDKLITQDLIDRVKAMPGRMNIHSVQKLDIDAVAMRQALMFCSVPDFDMGTLQQKRTLPQFLRYFGSSGAGLQCGFFSLGFQTRQEAINQILDNLVELEILAMADRNVSCSADIRRILDRSLEFSGKNIGEVVGVLVTERLEAEKATLRSRRATSLKVPEKDRNLIQIDLAKLSDQNIEERIEARKVQIKKDQRAEVRKIMNQRDVYAKLYAKKHGIKAEGQDFFDRFFGEYADLMKQIKAEEEAIDAQIDQGKKKIGIVGDVSDGDAATVSAMRRDLERQKWQASSRFVQFIYPLADFQEVVRQSMAVKFSSGELEFDPNPDWHLRVPTYPQMLAELNGYNIYAWVLKSQFERMQRARGASEANPIHTSEDGKYILVNYLNGSPNGKPMGLLNKSGGHFEKWIAADHARLARAVRHQNVYGKIGLTKDTGK